MTYRIAGMAVPIFLAACSSGLSDIRPDALKSAPPTSQSVARGNALLAEMFEAHGGLWRWRSFNFVTAKVSDEWFNSLFWTLAAPYTENPEHVAVAAYTHEFPNARVEFTGGKNAGLVWVADRDTIVRKVPSEAPERVKTADDGIFTSFVHNFAVWPTFPFILASVDRAAYIGPDEYQGQRYEKVLVSWGTLGPQAKTDQWILWINAESKRLERVWFTIRVAGEDAVGGYNLKAFKTVQGLSIATVCEGIIGLDEAPLHTYVLTDIEFSNRVRSDLLSVVP